MKVFRTLSALILVALAGSPALAAPQIGDKAPEVKIAKWMTHEPPALPGGKDADKHVFLVEFWATWCQPCWVSTPHLGELHKKYEKDGLVIIGVTVEEPEVVAKFIGSDKGGKKMDMPYFVGVDDEMGTTGVWTKDIRGIPYAFLVDKTGQVIWQGNPLGEVDAMDAAIPKVLEGKYSIEEAKEVSANEKKFTESLSALQMAYGTHDEEKIFSILDNLTHLKPMDLQPYLIKRQMLIEFKKEDQVPGWNARILEQFKDSPKNLRKIIEFELGKEAAMRDPTLMIRSAARISDITKTPEADTLAILARVLWESGRPDAAIETQGKAIAAAGKDGDEQLRKVLEYYKTMKRLSEELHPPTTSARAD